MSAEMEDAVPWLSHSLPICKTEGLTEGFCVSWLAMVERMSLESEAEQSSIGERS